MQLKLERIRDNILDNFIKEKQKEMINSTTIITMIIKISKKKESKQKTKMYQPKRVLEKKRLG